MSAGEFCSMLTYGRPRCDQGLCLRENLLKADDTNAMGLIEQAPQVLEALRGDAKQWKKVQSAFP